MVGRIPARLGILLLATLLVACPRKPTPDASRFNVRGADRSGRVRQAWPAAVTVETRFATARGVPATPVQLPGGAIAYGSPAGAVYAVRLSDHTRLWRTNLADVPIVGGCRSGDVALFAVGTTIAALSVTDGSLRWHRETRQRLLHPPLCAGGLVAVGAEEGAVYAWQVADGRLRWRRVVGANSSGLAYHRGWLYVADHQGTLSALQMRTGSPRWRRRIEGAVLGAPVVADDWIWLATGLGYVYALDVAQGTVRWRTRLVDPVFVTPALGAEAVYVVDDLGHVHALARTDGRLLWSRKPISHGPVPPLAFEDAVVVGGANGLFVLAAADGSRRATLLREVPVGGLDWVGERLTVALATGYVILYRAGRTGR